MLGPVRDGHWEPQEFVEVTGCEPRCAGTSKGLALGTLGAAGVYGDPKVMTRRVLEPVSARHWACWEKQDGHGTGPGGLHHPAQDFPLAPALCGGFGRFEPEQSED